MKWGVRRKYRNSTSSMSREQKKYAKRRANQMTKDGIRENNVRVSALKTKKRAAKRNYADAKSRYKKMKQDYNLDLDPSISYGDLRKAKRDMKVAKSEFKVAKQELSTFGSKLKSENEQRYSRAYANSVLLYKSGDGKDLIKMEKAMDRGKAARAAVNVGGGAIGLAAAVGAGVATANPAIAATSAVPFIGAGVKASNKYARSIEDKVVAKAAKKIQANGGIR